MRRIRDVVLVAAGSSCLVSPEAAAQELGVYRSFGRSDLREIGSAAGYGAGVRVLTLAPVTLHLGYYQQQEWTDRIGRVCNNYVAGFLCNEEAIRTRTALRGVIATAMMRARPLRLLEVEAGTGLSMNTVNGQEHTVSGRPSNLFARSTGQSGLLLVGSVRVRPVAALPLTVNAGLANHRLILRACANEPDKYSPYCGTTDVREFRIGVAYDGDWNRRISP